MAIKDELMAELKQEATLTRKMLERVPMDKKEWRPHDKSMTLGRLATHIAENLKWISTIGNADEFEFDPKNFSRHIAASSEELLQLLQTHLDAALQNLSGMTDDDLQQAWTLKKSGQTLFSIPKKTAMRAWGLSHHIHHRGQLSVYLRLLDIPVPGMYGPSADER